MIFSRKTPENVMDKEWISGYFAEVKLN